MKNNEHIEQVMLIKWFRFQYPSFYKCLWAIPNGGRRHISTAIKLKNEGVLAGVSDLFLMIPKKDKHGMFIEMKATKGGTIQQSQKVFMCLARSMGYEAVVCRGFDEAKKEIEKYLHSA
jgi:hypothetical protein